MTEVSSSLWATNGEPVNFDWFTWSGTNAEWLSAIGTIAGAVGTFLGAIVAGVFGYLTWNISRKTKDNQERATLTAAEEPVTVALGEQPEPDPRSGGKAEPGSNAGGPGETPKIPSTWNETLLRSLLVMAQQQEKVRFSVRSVGGESWQLVNDGTDSAFDVEVAGLTKLDVRRLTSVDPTPADVGAGDALSFTLVSRLTLSGPANVVVNYALSPGGPKARKVLLVPAD